MVLIEAKCLGWIIYVLVVMERQSSGTFLSRLFSLENPERFSLKIKKKGMKPK